jgi:hypothetical protein
VDFTLGRDELSFWNIDMENVVEPARLNIWITGSSRTGAPLELTIE